MTIPVGFFGAGGNLLVNGVVQITPGIGDAVRASGFDPVSFDSMRWPIGASRHSLGRYLFHESNIPNGVRAGDSSRFILGNVAFDLLFLINLIPIMLPRQDEGIVYACDIVDERYFWKTKFVTSGKFNISLDDKARLYDSSEKTAGVDDTDDVPHTPRTALTSILNEASISLGLFSFPATGGRFDDPSYLRDLDVTHWPLGKAVDCILTASGFVLIAYPSLSYTPAITGKRYEIQDIGAGEGLAIIELSDHGDELLGGGLAGKSNAASTPAGFGARAINPSTDLNQIVPASINIIFPTASENGTGWVGNDEKESATGKNFVTDRWHTVRTSAGIPSGVTGTDTVSIFDSSWAIVDQDGVVANADDLTTRADDIAVIYYNRFRSSPGELLFRDTQLLRQWSGAQEIIWSVTNNGAFTRTRGIYDHPLFGYRPALAHEIQTTGSIRAIPRPDGKILLDSPFAISAGAYPAILRIEDARYDGVNARDEFGFHEAQLNELKEWEEGGLFRTSTEDGALLANPAFNMGEFIPDSTLRGLAVLMRDHETTDGELLHLFQYPPCFEVIVSRNGGVAGTDIAPPTWSYTVFDLAGNVLDDSMVVPKQPLYRVVPFGNMIPAPNGSEGLAFYDQGSLKLFIVQEILDLKKCP